MTGNYYSLRRDHEKAIVYFRRALKLDRGYLSAWTLMGHEYIEIKNTNAAIASYRRAVGESLRFFLAPPRSETDFRALRCSIQTSIARTTERGTDWGKRTNCWENRFTL